MTVVPISCQSEGALEVYIEPVLPVPHLVIVGSSPMAHTLAELARALGWSHGPGQPAGLHGRGTRTERSMVIVATQGHGDEDMIERAVAMRARPTWAWSRPAAAARRCSATSPSGACPRTSSTGCTRPAGLDLGRTTHEEMAVAILAELVQLRASGAFADVPAPGKNEAAEPKLAEARRGASTRSAG